MKQFKGNKPLAVIKRDVEANGWPWDQSKYDQGGDWVTFGFMFDKKPYDVLYNTFNGKFMVRIGEDIITESDDHLDGTGWYDFLLSFIYEEKEAA